MAHVHTSRTSLAAVVLAAAAVVISAWHAAPRAAAQDPMHIVSRVTTAVNGGPPIVTIGKRYAFTWSGGGPAQTYTVKAVRSDGWVLVEVADENLDPQFIIPGQVPTRWLNLANAISIQEMRLLPY